MAEAARISAAAPVKGFDEQQFNLECGIGDAEADLLLLEIVIDEIETAPDAFDFFRLPRGDHKSKLVLVSEDQITKLSRVMGLLNMDVRKMSRAFFGTEVANV